MGKKNYTETLVGMPKFFLHNSCFYHHHLFFMFAEKFPGKCWNAY